jgi:hypothetical protein
MGTQVPDPGQNRPASSQCLINHLEGHELRQLTRVTRRRQMFFIPRPFIGNGGWRYFFTERPLFAHGTVAGREAL